MMEPEHQPELGTADRPAAIYPLLSDAGNRRMLVEWLENREGYSVVDPETPLADAQFDLCLFDVEAFKRNVDTLEKRKTDVAPIQLPYLLLLSDRDRQVIDQDRQQLIDNVVWRNVDEIIELPLGQTELYWRIESLLRIRRQSMQLADREGQYRSIVQDVLNSIDIGLVLFDAEDDVAWANDAINQLLGFPPADIRATDANGVYEEYLAPTIEAAGVFGRRYQQSFETTNSLEFPEFRVGDRWFTGRCDPITVGTLAGGVIHQYWEITRQRETHQQLSVVDRVLRHNLRNQLTVVRGRAADIAEAVTGGPAADAATIIEECNALMTTADKSRDVTELLTEDPTPKSVPLSERLFSVVTRLEDKYPDVILKEAIDPEITVRAVQEVEEAIEELAINGIVHNDTDEPTIELGLTATDEEAVVTVSDNGPGIPDVDQRVLERGEEMDDFYHGSGLGMWLVHLTVRKSGGSIAVTRASDTGSTVEVTLPLAIPESDV